MTLKIFLSHYRQIHDNLNINERFRDVMVASIRGKIFRGLHIYLMLATLYAIITLLCKHYRHRTKHKKNNPMCRLQSTKKDTKFL